MSKEIAGGHARAHYTKLVPGVRVTRIADITTILAPHMKLSLRCSNVLGCRLSNAASAPVADLPAPLVSLLSSNALAVCGEEANATMVAAMHASQNGALNGGVIYDDRTLRSWQDDARRRRLPHASAVRQYGDPFRAATSFPVDAGHHPAASLADVAALVEAFYHHLEVPYASAGALYPVHVVGELVGQGVCRANYPDFRAEWQPPFADAPANEDPTLQATPGRIWFVLDLEHAARKYGARSYRYALIETGAAATYLEHVAASLGLSSRQFGGFDDHEVARRLGHRDGVLVAHCIGLRPSEERCDPPPAISVQAMKMSGTILHMATAWDGKARANRASESRADGDVGHGPVVGQAVDADPSIAISKAVSELAERLAFVRSRELRTTNGMAAHPLRAHARLNACLELYERHCLLSRWFGRLSPDLMDRPDDELATALSVIASSRGLAVAYGALTDSMWQIPAAIVVVRSMTSGAVLLGTAAAPDLRRAVRSASQEVLKSLMHRVQRVPPGQSLFESKRPSPEHLKHAWEHESYWASDEVQPAETAVLVPKGRYLGRARAEHEALDRLIASSRITEVSDSFRRNRRHVVVASNPGLVPVQFGQCSNDYRDTVISRIGADPLRHWPHPLG